MRALWIGIVVVVIATGVAVWWLNGDVSLPTGEGDQPPPSGAVSEARFERTTGEEESFDAGFGRITGVVLDENGNPAGEAEVRLYAESLEVEKLSCGRCHESVFDCVDPSTATKLLAELRAGHFKAAPVIARTVADADGRFSFEGAPLDATVVATKGRLSSEGSALDEPVELMLQVPVEAELDVTTEEGTPLPAARVTIFSPRDGTLEERTTSGDGHLKLTSNDSHAWLAVEAPGYLPVGQRLESVESIVLSKPKAMIVRTKVGGTPVDAVVKVSLHGDPQEFRTQRGELRIDQLPAGYVSVSVESNELTAPVQGLDLIEPETVFDFELRKGSRLLVTVVDEQGQPLEYVDGSLSSPETSANQGVEAGAMLVLGPVPEGEYDLSVDAQGRIPFKRRIDLKPGDTSLEVTMRAAPTVKGVVLSAAGKPVPNARVIAWDNGEDVGGASTDEEGAFEVVLRYPGELQLKVEETRHGSATQNVVAPGGPYVIKLSERGVLVVEFFDFDGTPLPADLSARHEKTGEVRWLDSGDPGGTRAAGLAGGTWVLERNHPGRVPLSKKVEIVEGQETKVSLRLDKGVTVSGRVVDHEGKPVADALVTMTGRSELTTSGPDGRFTWEGAVAGPCELSAVVPGGSESPKVKTTAPASEIVLTFGKPVKVKGRVIDEQGRPLAGFEVNGARIDTPDGRFEVDAPLKSIDVWCEGFGDVYLQDVGEDVGDVVLKKQPGIDGVVLDQDGKPVSGAQVMTRLELMPVTTDAAGRFKLTVPHEDEFEVVAIRGLLSGSSKARGGAHVRIVMKRGTTVSGKVVDSKGRGVATSVTATSMFSAMPVEVESDASGRFQLELAAGVWRLSTRFNRVQRAIEVRSEPMEVTLGEESGSCGLVLRSSGLIDSVWLFSSADQATDNPWDSVQYTPGSIEVPVGTPSSEVSARGLPCGRFALVASVGGGVSSSQVDLRGGQEQLTIEPPREPPEEPSVEKNALP